MALLKTSLAVLLLSSMMMMIIIIMLVRGSDFLSAANYVGNGTVEECQMDYNNNYPQVMMNWWIHDNNHSKHFCKSHGLLSCGSSALQGISQDSAAKVVFSTKKNDQICSKSGDIVEKFEEKKAYAAAANQSSRTDIMTNMGLEEQLGNSCTRRCLRRHGTGRSNNFSDMCSRPDAPANQDVINGSVIMNNVFSSSCPPRILLMKKVQEQILEWNSTTMCQRKQRNMPC